MHQIIIEPDEQRGWHVIVLVDDSIAWITDSYERVEDALLEANLWLIKYDKEAS